jgi:hypothetical protein
MKRFLASIVLLSLILPSAWPRSAIAGNGEVGSYPNATSPLNGTERILADQSSSGYPCTSCTVNITPLQLSNFTAAQAASFGLLFNNAGAIGGLAPTATGQYCLDWASLTADPTLVTCSTAATAFSAITAGTNTAALVMGTGGSLTASGGTIDATSVGGYTLPCTVPTLVSGDYLTNNGTTCSWAAVSGGSFTVDTAPSGISVTPPCTYNMVKVTATDYQIAAPVQSAPTTSSTGGSLTGNVYYYVVTATTAAGQTTASTQQSIASATDSPPTNGALTQTAGGTLAATTYYVRSTWVTASGETTGATETSLAVSANNVLNVAAPASPPANATGWNVYVSTSTGIETKQNASPIATTTAWVEPTTGLIAGTALPGSNTAWITSTNENVVNWTAVTGATGYVVYRSTTSGNFTNATSYTVSGGTTVTFTDTGATGTTATPPTANTSGQFTINAPSTCTPTDGQKLELKIISPSGGIVTYAFNSAYLASGSLALPTTSYAAGKEDYFQTQYDADKSDWVVLSYNQGF